MPKLFDPNNFLIVTMDVRDAAIGATLEICKHNSTKKIGIIAYLSGTLNSYEVNWPVREKEFF